jgi:hypothetical protein
MSLSMSERMIFGLDGSGMMETHESISAKRGSASSKFSLERALSPREAMPAKPDLAISSGTSTPDRASAKKVRIAHCSACIAESSRMKKTFPWSRPSAEIVTVKLFLAILIPLDFPLERHAALSKGVKTDGIQASRMLIYPNAGEIDSQTMVNFRGCRIFFALGVGGYFFRMPLVKAYLVPRLGRNMVMSAVNRSF